MKPVVGTVPAKTPRPSTPRSELPETYDPSEAVMHTTPEGNVVEDIGDSEPIKKGAAEAGDPNPVEWRHVYAQLERNFPNDSLEWVKRARWIGPVNVPWDRIDTDDEDSWAASHQPDAVNRFAREIKSGTAEYCPERPGAGAGK